MDNKSEINESKEAKNVTETTEVENPPVTQAQPNTHMNPVIYLSTEEMLTVFSWMSTLPGQPFLNLL